MYDQLELNEMMEERHQLEQQSSDSEICIACGDTQQTVNLYKKLKQEKEIIEKQLSRLKDEIFEQMGSAVTLVSEDGELLATWKWSKPVKRLDTKRLKDEMPLIYSQFCAPGEPVRSFLVK